MHEFILFSTPQNPPLMRFVFFLCLVSFSTCLSSQETTFQTNGPDDYREGLHAFTNAVIWKDYNTRLNEATLVIREGKVVDAGKNIAVPQGAVIHDMKGKFIYPSFIDIFSDYGMPEVQKPKNQEDPQLESNTKGAYGWNQAIHTEFYSSKNFTVNEKSAEELRK